MFMLPLSILMSVAGTQFRDLRYITMMLLQAMFFLTPVMLARDFLQKPPLDILNVVNPAVPLINLFRDPMLYGEYWNLRDVIVIASWTGGLWVAAIAASIAFGRKVVFAL
jgi:ABC-type polysaccharide/polyol phosphate export permease